MFEQMTEIGKGLHLCEVIMTRESREVKCRGGLRTHILTSPVQTYGQIHNAQPMHFLFAGLGEHVT